MRIALAGFNLESVSFLPVETTIADFEHFEVRGDRIIPEFRGTNTVVGGFIDACDDAGFEMLPIVMTEAGARGPASDEAFEHYARMIVGALEEADGRVDGVLLHLHGALTTPTRSDPDAELAARVREAIGPAIPLMLALDYHGNLDEASIAPANATFGYRYSPHVDMSETGRRAGRCMARTVRGEINPVTAIARPRVMVPSICSATSLHPLADFVARAIDLPKTEPAIIDASVFAGFSYADVPNCGFSVVVVADGAAERAKATAVALSRDIFAARGELYAAGTVHSLEGGIDHALRVSRKSDRPVVILEHADRMNDSTHVLHALVGRDTGPIAVPYLWDPRAACAACAAGQGARIDVAVGGRSSSRAGGPVHLAAEVVKAGETRFVGTGPMRNGAWVDLGRAALLRAGNVDIIVTETPTTCIDTDAFEQFGLDPMDYDLVILRSKTHFRAIWESLAEEIVIVDTPDCGPADLTTLPYRHVDRKNTYPFNMRA